MRISGPGIGLALPAHLYPSELYQAPYDVGSNYLSLAPGATLPIPAGSWFVGVGKYSVLQYLDPVNAAWRMAPNGARNGVIQVNSDGFNYRVANLTGCPVGAVVTNAGNGSYVQSTTTVTASAGGSLWQAIVGGQVSVTSVANAGAGYTIAPLVFINAPPSPGVQATAYATIASGTVSGVTMINKGAGYTSTPAVTIQPVPTDPGTITTQATVALGTFGTGSIAAIICTNPGTPQSSAPTLTIAGAGASATATAVMMNTLTGATVYAGGTGYTGGALLNTVGGIPTATAVNTNPEIEYFSFLPRPAQALLAASSGTITSVSSVYDGGLFVGTPNTAVQALSGALITASASIAGVLGSATDTIYMQPAPG